MLRYRRRQRLLAMCLSALAGYVDALGYLQLGGFFVSFMSGNSTRLAIGIVSDAHAALLSIGLIASFVCGVMAGTLAGRVAPPAYRSSIVLALVAVLLALGAGFDAIGFGVAAIVATALAMGAENAVFERDGEVSIGVTYMTGTLVKLGQRLAGALTGGARWAWLSYLMLWASLVCGAAFGAAVYPSMGLGALWLAAPAAAALAAAAAFTGSLRKADLAA